jgi:hypothetical protein
MTKADDYLIVHQARSGAFKYDMSRVLLVPLKTETASHQLIVAQAGLCTAARMYYIDNVAGH